MKRILTVVVAVLSTISVFAEKGIVLEQRYVAKGALGTSITVTWYITESMCKMRMRFGDSTVRSTTFFIPETKNAALLMYNDGPVPAGTQRTYFSNPADKITMEKSMDVSKVTVTKTGQTKEIGGFNCEKIMIQTPNTETEAWVTKDFKADLYLYYPYFRSNYSLLGLNQEKIKGVPLSSVTKDLTGKVINTYEFVSVTKTELTEEDFKVPAEYKLSTK